MQRNDIWLHFVSYLYVNLLLMTTFKKLCFTLLKKGCNKIFLLTYGNSTVDSHYSGLNYDHENIPWSPSLSLTLCHLDSHQVLPILPKQLLNSVFHTTSCFLQLSPVQTLFISLLDYPNSLLTGLLPSNLTLLHISRDFRLKIMMGEEVAVVGNQSKIIHCRQNKI